MDPKMQRLLNIFADHYFLLDLVISLTGLSLICALTYAMRWLPGKASEDRHCSSDIQSVTVIPEIAEMGYSSVSPAMTTFKAEKERNTTATVE
jgi:hypothetical protein